MQLHKLIYADLQNREHCLMTFGPVIMTSLTSSPSSNVSLQPLIIPTSIMVKAENSVTGLQRFTVNSGAAYDPTTIYMNGNVRINSMSMQVTSNLGDPQPFIINYRRLEGKKNDSRTKAGFGGSSISRTIWIRLQRQPGALNTISGCYAVERATDADSGTGNEDLNMQFCNNLGSGGSLYTWDATRNACVLKNNICGTKEVFEGINSSGVAVCRSINDYLPYLVKDGSNPCTGTKTQVGIVRDSVTNKVSIECLAGGGTASCPIAFKSWTVSGKTCSGNTAAVSHGVNSMIISDPNGVATYGCNNGSWVGPLTGLVIGNPACNY